MYRGPTRSLLKAPRGWVLTCLLCASALVTGFAEPVGPLGAAPAAPNPVLSALPPNTWVKLAPERNPVGRSYSGIAGAYGEGLIFYFGGGHGSHLGNDVELFDVHRNAWAQATDIEKPVPGTPAWEITKGWGTPELTPKGRPYTEHTYQLTCYDPTRKVFVSALTSGIWTFDPGARRWSRLTPDRPEGGDIHTKMLVFDPGLNSPLYFATTGASRGVYRFDYDKARWLRTGTIPAQMTWNYIFAAYDTHRRLHMVSHPKTGLWTYDAARDEWRQIASTPKELAGVQSFAYDAEHRAMLFAQRVSQGDNGLGIAKLWAYHPQADRWEQPQANGTPPAGWSTADWGTLVYVPQYRAFVFLNAVSVGGGGIGGTTETWAYRYAP